MSFWNLFKPATKKSKEPDPKDLIGESEGYFRKPGVAVIKIKKGTLSRNDKIWIKGHTTDIHMTVESLEIDKKTVESAKKGQSVGIKVNKRTRRGDGVYRVT